MRAAVPSPFARGSFWSLVALACVGCAGPVPPGSVTRANSDVITREEIQETGVGDLYEAVERLRPLWLQSRGIRSLTAETEIAVLRDGNYFGPVESLRTIPANQAYRLEYVDAATVASLVTGRASINHVIESGILVTLGRMPR